MSESGLLPTPARWRALLAFGLGLVLPGGLRRRLYSLVLGYRIHPRATLGRAYIQVGALDLAAHSRIGHLSVIRNIDRVVLGEYARIGTFNWMYGFPGRSERHFETEHERASELIMEPHSSITSRHIVDCTNRVTIGTLSTVAGFYSQILTHGIDYKTNRQTSRPVTIGRSCLIGSRAIIVKGAVVPDGAVVAAGSTFRGRPEQTHSLYSGVPAVPVRQLDANLPYFVRNHGPVD